MSRKQADANRQAVLTAAAAMLREKGLDGVSIAEITAAVGLSHGGFYGQFGSKDDLVAQAIAEASGAFPLPTADAPARTIRALIARYLSPRHRDNPRDGCVFATLAGDVARRTGPIRSAFTLALRDRIARLATIAPGATAVERRKRSIATIATLVGTLLLARAVDDPALSDELLAAGAESLVPEA